LRTELQKRLAAYCERQFGGQVNLDVLRRIQRAHETPSAGVRMARLIAGGALLGLGRARQMVARRLTSPA
jgi:hypothetical protein